MYGYNMEILLHLASGHHRLLLVQRSSYGYQASDFDFLVVKWQPSNGRGQGVEETVLTGERLATVSIELDCHADDGLRRFLGKKRMEMKAVILR
jgi:hypothetical protein